MLNLDEKKTGQSTKSTPFSTINYGESIDDIIADLVA